MTSGRMRIISQASSRHGSASGRKKSEVMHTPVSYTHLDVYKRQVHTAGKSKQDLAAAHLFSDGGNGRLAEIVHRPVAVGVTDRIETVSYTHLDVYKRQRPTTSKVAVPSVRFSF